MLIGTDGHEAAADQPTGHPASVPIVSAALVGRPVASHRRRGHLVLCEWDLSVHFKDARARVMAQPIGVARPSPCSMPGREGVLPPHAGLCWGRRHILWPRSSTLICYVFCPAMSQSLASQL